CLLDELPVHLIPRHVVQAQVYEDSLFLNPECALFSAGSFPDEMRSLDLSRFALQGTTAWVRDPATGSLSPFWIGPQLEGLVRDLVLDRPVPASLPKDARAALAGAGILMSRNHAAQRIAKWKESIGASAFLFREKGYAPLSG